MSTVITLGTYTPQGAATGGVLVRMIVQSSGVAVIDMASSSNATFPAAWSSFVLAGVVPVQFRPTADTMVSNYTPIVSDVFRHYCVTTVRTNGDIVMTLVSGGVVPLWTASRPYIITKTQFTVSRM